MNVTLITCSIEISAFGIRQLAACLKQAGHRVRLVFLPQNYAIQSRDVRYQVEYAADILDQLAAMCADAQLIGFSLMTNEYLATIHVTQGLKARGISAPIIWGGIQPTVEPEECLKHADIVCVGEGEGALLELVERLDAGEPYLNVQNLWVNTTEGIRCNPLRPLIQDLDVLPVIDFSFEDEFIGDQIDIHHVSAAIFQSNPTRYPRAKSTDIVYFPIITSRGCPYTCTFCCNHIYAELYPHQKRLRWRSAGHVAQEIENAQSKIGNILLLMIVDDNFTARSIAELTKFCVEYKQRVGLPFLVQLSPATIDEERLDIMLDAGLRVPVLGVETPNADAAKFYHREQLHKRTLAAVDLLERNRHRFASSPRYQFLIDNPYETLEQNLETLRFGLTLQRPRKAKFYSLILFPGTGIYERAMQDGLIIDKVRQIYGRDWHENSRPYIQIWIRLFNAQFPGWLLKLLLTRWLVQVMTSRPVNWLLKRPGFRWLWRMK